MPLAQGSTVYFRADDGRYYRGTLAHVSPGGRAVVEYPSGQRTETYTGWASNLSTTPVPTVN